MLKENLQHKLLEQDVISKAEAASVKQLVKKMSSVGNNKGSLENSVEKMMRKIWKKSAVVLMCVEELVKSVFTGSVDAAMCWMGAIPKWCFREIFELEFFWQGPELDLGKMFRVKFQECYWQ